MKIKNQMTERKLKIKVFIEVLKIKENKCQL